MLTNGQYTHNIMQISRNVNDSNVMGYSNILLHIMFWL